VTAVIARSPVDLGLKALLLAAHATAGTAGRPLHTEIGSAPDAALLVRTDDGKLIDPYTILYPIASLGVRGTLGQPERSAPLMYQVTAVGRTHQSAQIMADLNRIGITSRVPGGAFLHPLDAGLSMVVSGRRTSELGTAEAVEGLWQVADTYVLEVQAL
jgi:hypothetical protein